MTNDRFADATALRAECATAWALRDAERIRVQKATVENARLRAALSSTLLRMEAACADEREKLGDSIATRKS